MKENGTNNIKDSKLARVPLDKIKIKENVRQHFDLGELEQLKKDIAKHGLLTPLLLRPNGKPDEYYVTDGERRLRALRELKWKEADAVIRKTDEKEVSEFQVATFLNRADLNPIEKAEALKKSLDRLIPGGWKPEHKKALPGSQFKAAVKAVALTFSIKEREVYKHLRLLELPAKMKGWLKSGRLLPAHGALLLTIPQEKWEAAQEFIAGKFACDRTDDNAKEDKTFPVQDLARWVSQNLHRDLASAPFPADRELGGEIACTVCPFNTGNQGTLFAGAIKGHCTAPQCFSKKKRAFLSEEKARMAPRFKGVQFIGFVGAVGKWNNSNNSNTPDSIKGSRIIEAKGMTKALTKALKTHSEAFGWAIVKPSQYANMKPFAVYTIEKPEVLEKAGVLRKTKEDAKELQGRGGVIRTDPKAQFIDNYYSERVAEALHEGVQKAKAGVIMDYAIEHVAPTLGEDRELAACGVTKEDKRTSKATPELVLRALVLADAWGNGIDDRTLKLFGIDPKAVKKAHKADALKAWEDAEKEKAQANETGKEVPGEKK